MSNLTRSDDWQTLIETRLRETTVLRESRADTMDREYRIALEISQLNVSQAEKEHLWQERTKDDRHPEGKSVRAYWRRLARGRS